MNGSEAKKYNPENILPKYFLHPPTWSLEPEFAYLARQIYRDITAGSFYRKSKDLGIGMELEVLFFSPEDDPLVSLPQQHPNPNYSYAHHEKLDKLRIWADTLDQDPLFALCSGFGRLGIEFRTRPSTLELYTEAISRLRKELQQICSSLSVWPVVYSQHIHTSLFQADRNLLSDYFLPSKYTGFSSHIHAAISDHYPLVLLPEEFDLIPFHPGRKNGKEDRLNPIRMEWRMLSSEYACDPTLNLLLSLRALQVGITRSRSYDSDYPEKKHINYKEAVESLDENKRLVNFFGQSIVCSLQAILRHYPALSRRDETLSQVEAAIA